MKVMSKRANRVSEAEAARDFPALLARVRAGAEVVIERDAEAVAVIRPAASLAKVIRPPVSVCDTSIVPSGSGTSFVVIGPLSRIVLAYASVVRVPDLTAIR